MGRSIRIAWVDPCQLTRECMTTALSQGISPLRLTPYENAAAFIVSAMNDGVDLIVLTAHDHGRHLPEDIITLRAAAFHQPIVLVSPNEAADQMAAVAASLRLGASGHLPLQSTGIEMAISSFVFAHEGGTFAPLQLLLAGQVPPRRAAPPRRGARPEGVDGKPGRRSQRLRKSARRLAAAPLIEGSTHDEPA
jgi:DNA-binding NarL/FixJ family response regulator